MPSKPKQTDTPLLWAVFDKTFHLVLTDPCDRPFVYTHKALADARCVVLNEGQDFPQAYVAGLYRGGPDAE